MTNPKRRKPTIHELEDILEDDGQRNIRLEPNGSISSIGEFDCDQETLIDERIRFAVKAERDRVEKLVCAIDTNSEGEIAVLCSILAAVRATNDNE